MPAKVTLSVKELDELIETVEVEGGDATELKKLRAEVEQEERLKKPAKQVNDEDYIAELRSKSYIEHGIDLECMVCHDKFDQLVSGTCEVCFRKWALSTKKRTSN